MKSKILPFDMLKKYETVLIETLDLPLEASGRHLSLPLNKLGKEVRIEYGRCPPISQKKKIGCAADDFAIPIVIDLDYESSEEVPITRKSKITKSAKVGEDHKSAKKNEETKTKKGKDNHEPIEEIERLKGYQYERQYVFNEETMRTNTVLICKYNNCNKVCNKTWDLLDHMRKHTGEKPYQCKICLKKFSQRGNVIKHKKMHQKEKLKTKGPKALK